jgi:hypothetical protein
MDFLISSVPFLEAPLFSVLWMILLMIDVSFSSYDRSVAIVATSASSSLTMDLM